MWLWSGGDCTAEGEPRFTEDNPVLSNLIWTEESVAYRYASAIEAWGPQAAAGCRGRIVGVLSASSCVTFLDFLNLKPDNQIEISGPSLLFYQLGRINGSLDLTRSKCQMNGGDGSKTHVHNVEKHDLPPKYAA